MTVQGRNFSDLAREARRLEEFQAAAAREGIELGRWWAGGRISAIFEVRLFRRAAPQVPLVAKMPWLIAPPIREHPDVQELGHGPCVLRLVSETGPFALEEPLDEETVFRMIEAPYAHQIARGTEAPLPRLHALLKLAERPVVIQEAVEGNDLAWMIQYWPGRARRFLPLLARAVAQLHDSYGPHGDLKPEHVITDFEGRRAPVLFDPLGPLTGGAIGSIGWQLPLPTIRGSHAGCEPMADLLALAQIVAACWGDRFPWSGRLAYCLCNLGNGRFAQGISPKEMRGDLPRQLPRVPEPWRGWALTTADAAYELWSVFEPVRGSDPKWLRSHLEGLAAIPAWVGSDLG